MIHLQAIICFEQLCFIPFLIERRQVAIVTQLLLGMLDLISKVVRSVIQQTKGVEAILYGFLMLYESEKRISGKRLCEDVRKIISRQDSLFFC